MNFFESQDRVHKSTLQLILLFSLAVVTLIVMVNLLVMVVFGYTNRQQLQDGGTLLQQMDWQTFAAVSAGTVTATGSRISELSGGLSGQVRVELPDLGWLAAFSEQIESRIVNGPPAALHTEPP